MTRRRRAAGMIFIFGLAIISSFLYVQPVQAQDASKGATELAGAQAEAGCDAAPLSPPCVGRSIKETAKVLSDRFVSPAFTTALVQGLLNISQFVVNRLAYESALLVANGGVAQGSLFYGKSAAEGFESFGLDVAGEAVFNLSGALNSGLGTNFDTCLSPGLPSLSLALGIKQKYQPEKPRCDIMEFLDNWDSFTSDIRSTFENPDQAHKAIVSKFAESLRPGQNELSASIEFNFKVEKEVAQKKQLEKEERQTQNLKNVVDPVTKETKTPNKVVENDFLDKIKKAITGETTQLKAADIASFGDAMGGLALTATSTFTNTLLSQLFNKIYKGLFDTSSGNQDPFNVEAVASTGQDPEVFSKVFATTPFATADYNAITEFVVCPPQGVANRNLNNCVIDSNFLAVISRGNSGAPLTVQEAIDEGLINGNWPLISPNKLSNNQDPLCYTYGFCYSNLVKLRKARVIPIGWELAAMRNSVSQPKSLQQVINEFNNCNAAGTIDASHPFCHLVDPDWVLKYPDTQCRATVNGEIRLTQLSPGRQGVCADTQSCLGENSKGECVDGYGYCVKEKNVWRFRGDECQAQYAGCLALKSTTDQTQSNFIINTVDTSVCGQNNAGCLWYQTSKQKNSAGTVSDTIDDTYEWLLEGQTFLTADHENDWKYVTTSGAVSTATILGQAASYTYENRLYFTRDAQLCSESDAGCQELISSNGAILNIVRNPSFEDDQDGDKVPDGWFLELGLKSDQVSMENVKPAIRGSNSLKFSQSVGRFSQYIPVEPNQFYTFSYYAISDAASPPTSATQILEVLDEKGVPINLSGFKVVGTGCNISGATISSGANATVDWKRFSCSFGLPSTVKQLRVGLEANANIRYDAIQLEPAEIMSNYATGLAEGKTPAKYIKVAPDYLNCTGSPTDPAACASYAQMCQSQDVGCNLYTPDDGDPAIPAVAGPLDACPAECVGYDAYKQEPTKYEVAKFENFIPTQAKTCSAQNVGCDSFTNLSASAEGGENIEYYTNLRACVTPEMIVTANIAKQEATFYTWEGSDKAGYQLRSWNLLESNLSDTTSMTFLISNFVEQKIGKAPCTKWSVIAKDQLVCTDTTAGYQSSLIVNVACDEHADILSNPDCREFYDADGFVHYREFSKTVTVSNQCQPYRKDVSLKDDCDNSGGFWDLAVGFCRYFGLTSESQSCPAEANGCRAYTGGAGRNAVTLVNETFENGSYDGFMPYKSVAASQPILISNESIATDGHSLRVTAGSSAGGVATRFAFLTVAGKTTKYDTTSDVTKSATCPGPNKITPAGCEITPDCVVGSGEDSCGMLVNKVVSGSTFKVQFWAKGSGKLNVGFQLYGIGQPTHALTETQGLTLSGSWQIYELGPFDSGEVAFSKNVSLYFTTDAGKNFYLDNLSLKQVQENITLIKNSWVVPSTCDIAPNGVASPQYYLGCEAYTDQNNNKSSLYQFSKLCSEKVVGCEKLYQTQQSTPAHAQVFNARCVDGEPAGAGNVQLIPGQTAQTSRPCIVNGKTYCTIAKNRSFCTFDFDGTFPEKLPVDPATYNGIMYGPETVIVPPDRAVFLVDNGSANCSSGGAGCQEVGKPKFSQNLSSVESFESKYFINDPDQYGNVLCTNDALFCEEYASTQNGNFYFKNPLDKTCEYRSGVEYNNKKMTGWFKKGLNEPCATNFVVAGDQAGIWKNGDTGAGQYAGWVGTCPSQQDLCSEFIDTVDTEGGLKSDGTSYYFLNNDKLVSAASSGSQSCNGKVSQKEGCALFNNRSNSELNYNASVSYIVSTYADKLVNKAANDLVDPVSCDGNGGQFALGGTSVNLCKQRCQYAVEEANDELTTNMSTKGTYPNFYERSCLTNNDCPTLKTKKDIEVEGTCVSVTDQYKLKNDSNTVLKVARDRSCAAWLACGSSRTSFNERTNKYEPICDAIDLCVSGGADGQDADCTQWDPRDPQILTDSSYALRDVTWNGYELSGYAIPNQLPVELYNQFNLNPQKACVKDGQLVKADGSTLEFGQPAVVCDETGPCDGDHGVGCEPIKPDYRLVYNAGSCDSSSGNGSSCQVGRCTVDGNACSKNAECATGACVIGSCQETKPLPASGTCPSGFHLDPVSKDACVDKNLGEVPCKAGASNGCSINQACVLSTTTAIGACFNNRCITDVRDIDGNGFADPINVASAREQSCRGYPEVDSPYDAAKVVVEWLNPGSATPAAPLNALSTPYTFKTGYQDSNVCAIDSFGNPVNCDCNYDRVEYGKGAITLFEPINTSIDEVPDGICSGGPHDGTNCTSDSGCANSNNPSDAGTCLKRTTQDSVYGWSGYCIEKDSSIQLYASTDPEDRACLTWLPVDQLTGATDLYGKFTSAGFEKQDAYYCADLGVAYDIGVGGDSGTCLGDCYCAETAGSSLGDCNPDLNKSSYNDDEISGQVRCDKGFFAILTGCDEGGPGLCTSDVLAGNSDSDWPYTCVPYLSYKTVEDSQGQIGQKCEPPKTSEVAFETVADNGTKVYALEAGAWSNKREFYNDCKVKGVLASSPVVNNYFDPVAKALPGYNMHASLETYPVCTSVVQVGRTSDQNAPVAPSSGEFNVAWTDRVWKSKQPAYTVMKDGVVDPIFGYTPATEPSVFGQSTSPGSRLNQNQYPDPYPHPFDICVKGTETKPVPSSGTCPTGFTLSQDNENVARAYKDFSETTQTAADRLKQLFARSYDLLQFNDSANYVSNGQFKTFTDFEKLVNGTYKSISLGAWGWDVRPQGDGVEKPTPPKVISLGTCVGTKCREGRTNAFSVDDQDQGDILGEGTKKISVSFFAAANSNQMPIRKIVVDWGDGKGDSPKWPTDSQSPPSPSNDNFYKNYRGLNAGGQEICSSKASEFGMSPEACTSSYVAFNHNYVCTTATIDKLKSSPRSSVCLYGSDGRLLNSPCTDGESCIYQPRVHVQDNWGWCTGFCDAGTGDDTNGCFGGDQKFGNECNIQYCPSEGDSQNCPDSNGGIDNPWVNYDGVVIVKLAS